MHCMDSALVGVPERGARPERIVHRSSMLHPVRLPCPSRFQPGTAVRARALGVALLVLAGPSLPAWSMNRPGTKAAAARSSHSQSWPGMGFKELGAALATWVDALAALRDEAAQAPAAAPGEPAGIPAASPGPDLGQAGSGAGPADPYGTEVIYRITWDAINDGDFIDAQIAFEGAFIKAAKERGHATVKEALAGRILKNKRGKVRRAYVQCLRMARKCAAEQLDVLEASCAEADRAAFEDFKKEVEKDLQAAVRDVLLVSCDLDQSLQEEP